MKTKQRSLAQTVFMVISALLVLSMILGLIVSAFPIS